MSETVLGKALEALGVRREEFVVSTKCGRYEDGFDFSAERVTRSVDESLARLRLEYVDILQCHDIEFGGLDQVYYITWFVLRTKSSFFLGWMFSSVCLVGNIL